MVFCAICGRRLATYRCRRCGRLICPSCMGYHGLCVECSGLLRPVRRFE